MVGATKEAKDGENGKYLPESQCGEENESQHVESYDGTLGVTIDFVEAHQGPVGNIQWNDNLGDLYQNPGDVGGVRWCSGTMISEDLFLTAGHCFEDSPWWILPRIDGTSDVIPPDEIAINMHVDFNFQLDPDGNPRDEQSYAITELVEHRLNGLDYAIVRLEEDPGDIFGITPVSSEDAAQEDMLAIIGHPAGQRKQVEAGPATGFTNTKIKYNDVDTLGGSSGSGILHADYEAIVGVHTNGGCDDQSPQGGGYNYGVRISAIVDASPVLDDILQSMPDLIIESMSHEPATPTTVDMTTFTVVVKNAGLGVAGPSTLSFRIGGESSPPTFSVPNLAPGEAYTVQRQDQLGVAQNYRTTVTADVNNDVPESNEANNKQTDSCRVLPPSTTSPDLTIETLTHTPGTPTTADEITFVAVVKNVGAGSAGPSTLSFRIGGESSPPTFSVPNLAPGEAYTVQRRLTLGVAQNYLNTVIVDVNNDVPESNEANNKQTDRYTVVEP
jgi:V8-like Glu-specific endopeptidase